jgi:drug/metabolite transporter, DME family
MLLGLLLIGLASISWGTTGATMTLIMKDSAVGPLFVGWVRLAVAAPCLALGVAVTDRTGARRAITSRLGSDGHRSGAFSSYALLGLAMAAYQVCYFRAVTLTGVAVAALVAICSAPLMIALLAALLLRERLTAMVRMSLGVAVAGTALLVVGPRELGQVSGHSWVGALLALGAGVSYAVYAVTAKRVLAHVAPLPVAAITFTLAAVFLAPALFGERVRLASLTRAWPLFLYLGVGPTAAAYVLFTVGLRRVPVTAAGITSLLEPLTATLLGVVLFGESLGALSIAGALLLLLSFGLLLVGGQPLAPDQPSRAISRSRG